MNTIKVPFSSFLAGALLVNGRISYIEIAMLWTEFENKYNAQFIQESEDFNYGLLKRFFKENINVGFFLNGKYTDVDNGFGGRTIYECLYSFTNEYVREFFGNLPDKYDPYFKWDKDNDVNRKRS